MKTSRSSLHRAIGLAASIGILVLASGCDGNTKQTPGQQLDAAIKKTEDVTRTAARKAESMAETARDNTKAYIDSAKPNEDLAAVTKALKNAGSTVEETARDAGITASVSGALAKDSALADLKIEVHTNKRVVKLSGAVPTAELKGRAATVARQVNEVASVDNALEVVKSN